MDLSSDFPLTNKYVYLDNAATSLTPAPVAKEVYRFLTKMGGNYGRSSHTLSRKVSNRYGRVREKVKKFLGTKNELVFTKSSTEAINLVAKGLQIDGNIVTSTLEHHSNLVPWIQYPNETRFVTHREGMLSPTDFEEKIDNETSIVAVTHVSNIFGSKQPVEEVGKIAHEYGAYFLVDGAQAVGHIPVDIDKAEIDFYAFSGHKGLLGPQGTGGLVLTKEVAEETAPLLLGGGAVHSVSLSGFSLEEIPQRFEAGTPNLPGVAGLGEAVDYVKGLSVERVEKEEKKLADQAVKGLKEIEEVELYRAIDSTGILSFNLENMAPQNVGKLLDRLGNVCVRTGHHCAIPAIEQFAGEGVVRASFAVYNTEKDVSELVKAVKKIAEL